MTIAVRSSASTTPNAPERLVFGMIACAAAVMALQFFDVIDLGTIGEHTVIENMQVAVLAAAAFVFWLVRREETPAGHIVVATACMIVMLTGLVRELDVKTWDGPALWNWLSVNGLQEILMVGGGLIALAYLAVQRKHFGFVIRRSFELASWPFHIAVICVLLGGWGFDRHLKWVPHAIQFEEFFEFVAYALFLVAALRTLQRARQAALVP